MKNFFDSEAWKWIRTALEVLFIVAVIWTICFFLNDTGLAEEDPYADCTQVWVLCNDDSCVLLREKPKKTSYAFGAAECGNILKTDGKQRNGFLHVVDVAAEKSKGWVSLQYIVCEEPIRMEKQTALVVSIKRLAARKGINGKVKKWLKPMSEVNVLYMTSEWCLTNYGYVKTEYLEMVGEGE